MKSCSLLFALPLLGLALPATLSADPLTEEQSRKILDELQHIQDVLDGKRVSLRTSAVHVFNAAAASDKAAYEFYLECHKKLKFDDRGASYTEFRDWREKNEAKVKTKSNLAAMRLQLQYLVLTLRAAEGVDRGVIVSEVEQFAATIVSHAEELDGTAMRTLRAPVRSSIFAEAYELDRSLEVDNWNYSPGNFADAYEKTIFPYVREVKPEALAQTWDRRINLERNYIQATRGDDEIAMEKFETEQLPRLYWQKALDLFLNLSQQQGAVAMLNIIKTYPTHSDIANWVGKLKSLVEPPEEDEEDADSDSA